MIFVDHTFWLAVCNKSDPHNQEAGELLELFDDRPLMTTELVRGAVWDVLREKAGPLPARAFSDALDRSPKVRLVPVPPAAQREAIAAVLADPRGPRSFLGATSHSMMRRHSVVEALAFDPSFERAGFIVHRA